MTPFEYVRADSPTDAVAKAGLHGARLLGGGTNLVDLMRQSIERPVRLVDVSGLPASVDLQADGTVLVGAALRNSALAAHPVIRERYPLLARALLSGASAQVRNMATVGGNLLQRTRCMYFYDSDGARCNKRQPGSGCDAQGGFTRYHAVLGVSDHCIATHPSDMCVALVALDAEVIVRGSSGRRTLPIQELHRLPGERPDLETTLQPGEVIEAIRLPALPAAVASAYRKVRDRASFAFALVSVGAVLGVHQGRIETVRIGLGGVAPKPWRAAKAEAVLLGRPPSAALFQEAADAELAGAHVQAGNAFKPALVARTLVAVLAELSKGQA